jgi:cellobiose-specific phosphotransferase system component IIA
MSSNLQQIGDNVSSTFATASQGANTLTGSTINAVNTGINTVDSLTNVVKVSADESANQLKQLSQVTIDLQKSIGSASTTVIDESGSAAGKTIESLGNATKITVDALGNTIKKGSDSVNEVNNIVLEVLKKSKANTGQVAENTTQSLATLTNAVADIATATKKSVKFGVDMLSFTTTIITTASDKIINKLTQELSDDEKQKLIKSESIKAFEISRTEFRRKMENIIKGKVYEANGYIRLLTSLDCSRYLDIIRPSDACSKITNDTRFMIKRLNAIGYTYLIKLANMFTTAPVRIHGIKINPEHYTTDKIKNEVNIIFFTICEDVLKLIDELINELDKIITELQIMVQSKIQSPEVQKLGGKRKSKRRAFKKRRSTKKNRSTRKHK